MSEMLTAESAAAALAAAVVSDAPDAPAQPTPAAPVTATAEEAIAAVNPATPALTPQEDAGAAPDEESLIRAADIDLTGLTPEQKLWLDARERDMQAVMTKRTQEAAETVKLYEGIEDPAEAREALAFYQGIRSDPNYAAEVYDFLTTSLQAAGYSPAQAAAAALAEVQRGEIPVEETLPEFEDDPDEAIKARFAQLDKRYGEIEDRFQAAEAKEAESILVNEILRADGAIRLDKGYGDEEMDMIYVIAESTQGDLFAAEKRFTDFRETTLQNYLAAKQNSDDPAPPANAPAHVPVTFATMEDAHKAAVERLKGEMAAGT